MSALIAVAYPVTAVGRSLRDTRSGCSWEMEARSAASAVGAVPAHTHMHGCLATQAGAMRHDCARRVPAVKPWQRRPAWGCLAGVRHQRQAHHVDPCHGYDGQKAVAVTLVLMQIRHAGSESKGKSVLTLARMSQRAAINRLARRAPVQVQRLIEFIGSRLEWRSAGPQLPGCSPSTRVLFRKKGLSSKED